MAGIKKSLREKKKKNFLKSLREIKNNHSLQEPLPGGVCACVCACACVCERAPKPTQKDREIGKCSLSEIY